MTTQQAVPNFNPQMEDDEDNDQQTKKDEDNDQQTEKNEDGQRELNRLVFDGVVPFSYPSEVARRSCFDDFSQVQRKIENPVSDTQNPHFSSKFLSLEALLAMARPILNEHNFTLTQSFGIRSYSRDQVLGTYLLHMDGAMMSSAVSVPDLGTPQAVVSYSTYMRRVQLCALLGIRDENDDDGNAAQDGAQMPWNSPPQQQQPQTAPPWQQQAPPQAPPPMQQAPPWQQQQAQQPMQQAPTQMPQGFPPQQALPPAQQPGMTQAAPMQAQQPMQQQAAPQQAPPPVQQQAQVAPPPAGAIQGDTLAEAQNIVTAMEQFGGPNQKQLMLQQLGLPDISHMLNENYALFMQGVEAFLKPLNKSIKLAGPEGGNQVFIQ